MPFELRQRINDTLETLGAVAQLMGEALASLRHQRPSWSEFVRQLYFVGVKSQSVVLTTGAATGMVLCAQTYFQFHKVGLDTATGAVVSVGMASELGPVLAGLMLTARVGASMAAELGTMRVTEQIDALRTLATHPVDYLVVPRLLALTVAAPLLTAEAVLMGILASYVVGVKLLGIEAAYYVAYVNRYTAVTDIMIGLIKAVLFGGAIALICCYKGLTCPQGAEGVGRATTEAVVAASITILVSNFFLTLLLTQLLT
ncbi:MAG TPA: ABC transporter permease [Verrucomicrobiota bacterium]|nr:ABC transporter permease [Verrucomicrobiota bacterium]